jgi:hypothetical protein
MYTVKRCKKVNQLKFRHLLYIGSWYTVFWRQATYVRKDKCYFNVIPCWWSHNESKHVAVFNVILWYKISGNKTVHFVALSTVSWLEVDVYPLNFYLQFLARPIVLKFAPSTYFLDITALIQMCQVLAWTTKTARFSNHVRAEHHVSEISSFIQVIWRNLVFVGFCLSLT